VKGREGRKREVEKEGRKGEEDYERKEERMEKSLGQRIKRQKEK
jgi:hypothetical protein